MKRNYPGVGWFRFFVYSVKRFCGYSQLLFSGFQGNIGLIIHPRFWFQTISQNPLTNRIA